MNTQQAVVIVFMTGLLLVLIAVGFTAFEEQLKNPIFIRYTLISVLMLAWLLVVFVGDLYMMYNQIRYDLKNYQKQNHEVIMKRYVDAKASCPK